MRTKVRTDLSSVKLSKIRDIQGGTCLVMFPTGSLVADLCCTAHGSYKNILRFVDACLDGSFERLGCTREHFHSYIKNKVNIDYMSLGGDHILTVYTRNNVIVVFSFYTEEKEVVDKE